MSSVGPTTATVATLRAVPPSAGMIITSGGLPGCCTGLAKSQDDAW